MTLDPLPTAVVTLDFQSGILSMLPSRRAVTAAGRAVGFARAAGFHREHVGIGFRAGYPEIPEAASGLLQQVKQHQLFATGSPSAAFEATIAHPETTWWSTSRA